MIKVVIGIVFNDNQELLISKRQAEKHLGGLWEFPGGKIEENETAFDALKREFQEEVNLTVIKAEPLIQLDYAYSDKSLLLDVWTIHQFSGEAQGLEGQAIRWITKEELKDYEFPEINRKIIQLL